MGDSFILKRLRKSLLRFGFGNLVEVDVSAAADHLVEYVVRRMPDAVMLSIDVRREAGIHPREDRAVVQQVISLVRYVSSGQTLRI